MAPGHRVAQRIAKLGHRSLAPRVNFAQLSSETALHALCAAPAGPEHRRLRAAIVEEPGFFVLSLPEEVLSPATVGAAYRQAQLFFRDLPDATKRQYHVSQDPVRGRGWTPCGEEPSYEAGRVSTVEAFDVGRELLPGGSNGDPAMGPNVWPAAELPDFQPVVGDVYDRLTAVAQQLFASLAFALGLPVDAFRQHACENARATMRLLRYPAVDTPAENVAGISSHTDFEVFTIMHQSAPGLQLRPRGGGCHGEWTDAPGTDAGEALVIMGDMLEVWTNGTVLATPHRVEPTPWERYSLVRFNGVSSDTVVKPLDAFGAPRYAAVSMGDHMDRVYEALNAGEGAHDTNTWARKDSDKGSRAQDGYTPLNY